MNRTLEALAAAESNLEDLEGLKYRLRNLKGQNVDIPGIPDNHKNLAHWFGLALADEVSAYSPGAFISAATRIIDRQSSGNAEILGRYFPNVVRAACSDRTFADSVAAEYEGLWKRPSRPEYNQDR